MRGQVDCVVQQRREELVVVLRGEGEGREGAVLGESLEVGADEEDELGREPRGRGGKPGA
jgi:hypothetical protein